MGIKLGENCLFSKLKDLEVENIFVEYFTTDCNISFLAKKYNVNSSTIGNIVNRNGWPHITKNLLHLRKNRESVETIFNFDVKTEIWKKYIGFENLYEISNFGRLKRLEREILYKKGGIKKIKEKIVSLHDNGRGYLFFVLTGKEKNKRQYIHRAVAIHFIENPRSFHEVNHKDGNKSNNNATNLIWCCPSTNQKHSYDFGLKTRRFGELNPNFGGK